MAKGNKPTAGSRAFWPRKRAKRIYPKIKAKKMKEAKPLGFAGYKAGMLSVCLIDNKKGSPTYGKEIVKAATVIDCPELTVAGIKAYKNTTKGLQDVCTVLADKLSKDLERKMKLPKKRKRKLEDIEKMLEEINEIRLLVHTNPRKSGIRKKKPEIFEIPLGGDVKEQFEYARSKLGQNLKVGEIFKEGEYIDVIAVTKGKGYEGPVKRFGVTIRPRKHEKKRRHVGNLGAVNVARVLPGKIAMPGQLGFQTRTEYNKKILKIAGEGISPKGGFVNYGIVHGDYVLIEGSVPGPKKRLIMLRHGIRAKAQQPVQIKQIFLHSQQG